VSCCAFEHTSKRKFHLSEGLRWTVVANPPRLCGRNATRAAELRRRKSAGAWLAGELACSSVAQERCLESGVGFSRTFGGGKQPPSAALPTVSGSVAVYAAFEVLPIPHHRSSRATKTQHRRPNGRIHRGAFLESTPVESQSWSGRFASFIRGLVSDRKRQRKILARFLLRLLTRRSRAFPESSGLKTFVTTPRETQPHRSKLRARRRQDTRRSSRKAGIKVCSDDLMRGVHGEVRNGYDGRRSEQDRDERRTLLNLSCRRLRFS